MKPPARRQNGRRAARGDGEARDGLLRGVEEHRLALAAQMDELAKRRAEVEQQRSWLAIAQGRTIAAERLLTEMYQFMPVPYLVLSDLGVIVRLNQRALDLLGSERSWVVGRPLVAYVGPKDLRTILNDVYRAPAGQVTTVEVDVRTMRGVRRVQMIVRSEAGGYRNGGIFHVAMIDLTAVRELDAQRREAERRRRQSEDAERVARAANVAKDEFLAMLSHELRTPLTPILAAADSLVAHDSLPAEVVAKLEVIRRNVRAEAHLIDDLLDVARITRRSLNVARTPIALHDVLQHVVDAWSDTFAGEHLTVDVRLEAERQWVEGDEDRLGQVFRNLVGNAVKFSQAGGRISVRTEEHEGRIRVTVADEGAGMTDKQLAALFKPFVHAEKASARRGLGLGLLISRAIVEAHEGTLEVWSRGPGCGTTVRVELDAIAQPAHDLTADTQATTEKATATVLLVEDDRDSADMLALLLAAEGFETRIARSVHEARALAGFCELIVSDISLPDGTGLDLMREIRAAGRTLPGVALSGYGSLQDVNRSLDAGFEEHLTKPVDLERLVAAVRRLACQRA